MRSKPRRQKTKPREDANAARPAVKGRAPAVGQEAYNAATPPTNLDFEKSLMFFHAYMYGPLQGKLRLYRARGIPHGSVAMPSDWEVFASMIVNDLGRKVGGGIDLTNNEVKSAKRPGGYEYQYHKRSGHDKLLKDMEVGHLFFEWHDNLREVELRWAHGSQMREFFDNGLRKWPEPYLQRYRTSISYGWVRSNATLLMVLREGEVVYPTLKNEEPRTSVQTGPDIPEEE